jgi:hypothetical protein
MSHLDDLLAAHGVQFSAPSAGVSEEDPAAVLVASALANLTELGEALELAFREKDDEDGGSTGQGSDKGDAKKPPFGKKKPPFGKSGSKSGGKDDRDDDEDEDDGPPWAKKGGGNDKKPPFGKKKNQVKASALLDAAMVALSGLNAAQGDWVEMTARDNMALALSGKKPYGNVSYADPGHQKDGKSRYPTDTPEHTRAAWSYVNQKENGDKYAPEDLAKVKSKIRAAMRKHGIKGGDDKDKES